MFRIEGRRRHLYQWDMNQRLMVDATAGAEIHFSSECDSDPNTKDVQTYEEDGKVYANIPNTLLQQGVDIKAYLYIENGEEGHTEAEYTIIVKPREKPAGYVYTETEVLNYSSLLEQINMLTKRVEELERGGGTVKPDATTAVLGVATLGNMILGG